MALFDLPREALVEIFRFVEPETIIQVCPFVCKAWKEAADSVELWRYHCDGTPIHASLTGDDVSMSVSEWKLSAFWPGMISHR